MCIVILKRFKLKHQNGKHKKQRDVVYYCVLGAVKFETWRSVLASREFLSARHWLLENEAGHAKAQHTTPETE